MRLGNVLTLCISGFAFASAAWNKGYPPSCTCKETGVTASECSLFSCDCNCDITVGQCDYQCCCDPDCTTEQVARFKSTGTGCVDYAANKVGVRECYSGDELKKVNPGAPMKGRATSVDAVDELLCVVKENHNFKGEFYETASTLSAQVFSTPKGTKEHSYDQAADSASSGTIPDSHYDKGDFIPAYVTTGNSSAVQLAGGYLAVPQADFTASCNDNYFAEFETDVAAAPCGRAWSASLSEFTAQCEVGSGSVGSFSEDIFLLSRPTAAYTVNENRINISIAEVLFVDFDSGHTTDVTAAWISNDCFTGVDISNANCQFASGGPVGSTCNNAVLSVQYLVLHAKDAYATIIDASVRIRIADLSFGSFGGGTTSQYFGIDYFDESTTYNGAKTGQPANRTSSGNPGYLYGLPVLYGTPNSTTDTIDQRSSGLTIQSPTSDGSCPSGGAPNYDMVVDFGYDVTTSCLLSLNRSAFESLCCEGSSSCAGESEYTDSSGIPFFLKPQEGYIGIYGNADPAEVKQWLPLEVSVPGSSRSWTASSGTCNSLITGVNYKFLVAYTGERKNPQNKIISVAVDYTLQDVSIRTSPKDDSATQTIPFTVTASFIFKDDSSLQGYNPPRPPVLFSVPYDIFYPFDIDSSAAPGLRSQFGWASVAATVVLTIWTLPLFQQKVVRYLG